MRFVLPLVAALLPIVIAPGVLFYFDVTPKIAIVLIGTAAALLLWKGELPLDSRVNRVFLVLVAAEALSLLLSTIFSTDRALSLNGGNWRRFGLVTQFTLLIFATLAAADCASSKERVTAYLRAIVAGGIPVALYAIAQYFRWDPWLPRQAYSAGEGAWSIVRPPSTMGHAAFMATYLLLVVFASLGLWERRVWRPISIAAALLGSTAIVLSGTRAAIVGLAAGGIVAAWRTQGWKLPAAAAAGIALAAIFYSSPLGQELRHRANWTRNEPLGGARPLLWRDSLLMSAHHLGFGYGPETFIREFPRSESKELARAYPDFLHESPHDIFLDALTAQGLPGLLILAALSAWGLFAARRSPWLLGALIAMLLAQLFTAFVAGTAFFFFLALALAVEPAGLKRVPMLRIAAYCTALLLVAWGARLVVADRALHVTAVSLDRGDLAGAEAAHQRAIHWALPGAGPELFCSRRFAEYARASSDFRVKARAIHDATSAAVLAIRNTDEPPNAWYNLAMFLAIGNSQTDVERSLHEAIAAAPNWYKPHWVLAQLLAAEHRLDEARRESEFAYTCNSKEPAVLNTLENIRAAQRH